MTNCSKCGQKADVLTVADNGQLVCLACQGMPVSQRPGYVDKMLNAMAFSDEEKRVVEDPVIPRRPPPKKRPKRKLSDNNGRCCDIEIHFKDGRRVHRHGTVNFGNKKITIDTEEIDLTNFKVVILYDKKS